LYVDTFKVLSHFRRYECTLYDNSDTELDRLESDLEKEPTRYKALYIEFPGNPLLGSPDLVRIHALARQYGFAIILDDTIATSVNLNLLTYTDIVCTSLTKMFSGACNVMGGSIVINPDSPHHHAFSCKLETSRLDSYFPSDVLVMAANSSDFPSRVRKANKSAAVIATKLRNNPKVLEVFYPEGSTSQKYYDQQKRANQGYGFLLSINFVSPSSAIAFYDSLAVAKGPSLGTNSTLSCAYAWLAHAQELEWAAKHGVTEHLVRISVGIEETSELESIVDAALAVA
jgi:cystathionine gamma-synthase